MAFLLNFWELLVIAAPWLLLGFGIAGLINAFIPEDIMSRYLGAEGFGTTVKAALIGAPLPLCSCGVIPAALGLRRSGASKSATVSFLVATPETGVDSVSVSYAMLGPVMAIVRPIAAICSAIVAGALVGREENKSKVYSNNEAQDSCCVKQTENQSSGCCDKKNASPLRFSDKLISALHFATGKLIADTALWLVIGLFFAAMVQTFVSHDLLASYGNGILAMTVMLLVSIPMYICATASTPIAAGLMFAGVSPGAVLVFMLAGPATNIATLGVVGRELGKRPLFAYLFGVIVTAMIFGWGLDAAIQYFDWNIRDSVTQHAHLMPESVSLVTTWILLLLLLRAFFNQVRAYFSVTFQREQNH